MEMSQRMKNFVAIAVYLFYTTVVIAQSEPKWTDPVSHPCYKGLKISVVNMGYLAGNYHWGVSISNNYQSTVSFRYKLIVGGKGTNYYGVAFRLKYGEKHTEGTSFFNGISFDNPSADWVVAITDVCFDGSTCGGPNECYADCDAVDGKENQQCDATGNQPGTKREPALMSGTALAPGGKKVDAGYKGEFAEWMQEGRDIKLTIGQDTSGIYWKKKADEPPVLFTNIRPGTYRYEKGSDFFIIRFESENRISFWNNGSLVGYFKRPEAVANKGKGFLVPSGDWSPASKLEVVNGGIRFKAGDIMAAKFYKQISPNEYKWSDPDGVHYCILKAVADKKLEQTCGGASGSFGAGHFEYLEKNKSEPIVKNETVSIEGEYWPSGTAFEPVKIKIINGGISLKNDSYYGESLWTKVSSNEYQSQDNRANKITFINANTFRLGIATYSKALLWPKAEKWINNDPAQNDQKRMLYIDNDGLHEMSYTAFSTGGYQKLSYFHQKISTDVYEKQDRSRRYKITSPTSLTYEYLDIYGNVVKSEYYTKAPKQ